MTISERRPDARPAPPQPAVTASEPVAEPHPDIPVVGPLAGAFTWDIGADLWTWSDEMYVIHGFSPREVVPTTDLLMAHKHPEDRARTEGVVDRFLRTGERYACYHRIIDAQDHVRHVLVIAGGLTDAEGAITEMSGFMIDLTTTRRNDMQSAIREALDGALEHRGEIDMAKGALMLGYRADPDEAFAVLRAASNQTNLKVSEIAHRLVTELSADSPAAPEHVHELLGRITRVDYTPPDAG